MRFTARFLALTCVGALALVGLSVPASSAATALAVSTAPAYNAASTTETVTGTAKFPNDTVAVNLTSGSVTTAARMTTSASDGTWTVTFTASDVQALQDGTVTATVGETYCSGLLGTHVPPCSIVESSTTAQATKTFLKDIVVPAAVTVGGAGNAAGYINTSNKGAVTVNGSGAESGNTVSVTIGSLAPVTTTAASNGTWFVNNINASALADGNYTASATQTDGAGNTSAASTKSVTKDTVGPRPNGTSPADGATVAPPAAVSFTYHDTLGSGSTVTVATGSTTVDGTATFAAGTVTFKPTTALASGSYSATATVYDAAGNQTVTTISFTVDATAPAVTSLKSTATSLNTANTTVTGSLSEAATLTITSTDSTKAKTTTTVSKPAGNFSVSYSEASIGSGTITVSVKAVDAVGNASTSTTTHTRTLPAGTTVSLSVPTWSAVGWPITLSGSVHLLKAGAYGSVTLVHTSLSGKQQILATVSVSSSGAYSYRYTPTTSGKYYAIYNAVSGSGAQSPTYSSEVRYAISVSAPTGSASTKAVISGAVHNPPAGVFVIIYKKNADGSLTKLGTATVDSTHHYRFSVLLPKGSTAIRVSVPPSHGFYGNSANVTATRT